MEYISYASARVCVQTFLELKYYLNAHNWNLIFTDGSKIALSTSFAVVSQDFKTIKKGLLHNWSSVFTAELLAIYIAALHASKSKRKYCICSDSRSAIDAIQNINNNSNLVINTRDILIKYQDKINILWLPAHCGIAGNEYDDSVAKSVHTSPCPHFKTFESSDIRNTIANGAIIPITTKISTRKKINLFSHLPAQTLILSPSHVCALDTLSSPTATYSVQGHQTALFAVPPTHRSSTSSIFAPNSTFWNSTTNSTFIPPNNSQY